MYILKNKDTFVKLSKDLKVLVFGNDKTSFQTNNPFVLDLTGIPVNVDNMLNKEVIFDEEKITLTFSDIRFAARFPGNSYCRPDARFAPKFKFSVTLSIEDGDLIIKASPIENIGKFKARLILAQGFFTASTKEKAAVVLPVDHGIRFDFPRNDIFSKSFKPSVHWSLPVHGLFRENGGIGLWCEELDRDYNFSFNTDLSATVKTSCVLHYDKDCNTQRSMRFMLFGPNEDFQQLGLRCRQLRKASGRFRSLKEKAAAHPEVANLPGTVFWKHNVYWGKRPEGVEKTYSLYVARPNWNENEGLPNNWTAEEVFQTAHNSGFDRVTICNTGWNRDGFDAGYPCRFPVNSERGTLEEFKDAVKKAHQLSEGYTLSVHDNYLDVYEAEEFNEEETIHLVPKAPHTSSIWRGGQAHFLCSTESLRYAKRDLPKVADITGKGCIYLDVTAATSLENCYSDKHPLNRAKDLENKRNIFFLAEELFGSVAVEGCGTDHYADIITIGAYGCFHFFGLSPLTSGPYPVPVPLWQMVYHDSVLNYVGEGYLPIHGSEYRLYQALYTFLPTSFDEHSKVLTTQLRSACTAQLLKFEDLQTRVVNVQNDGSFKTSGVSKATYSDGTVVVANFNDTDYCYNDTMIPAREYKIFQAK